MTFRNDRLSRVLFSFGIIAALLVPAALAGELPKVDAPRRPVTDVYHGTTVVDDYQWLENSSSPEVRAWTAKQNERSREYFDRLPYREGIADELMRIRTQETARYTGLTERHGTVFALRIKPPAQQPVLVRFTTIETESTPETVFDPNLYNTNGTTAIDWYLPSPKGDLVAVSLSENGSEDGQLHFFETATGKELADRIPRVQYPTGGGSVAWTGDGKAVLYTRYPHAGERAEADLNFYQQVWFHRLGTPVSEDRYEIGKEFPRIAEIELDSSEDGQWFVAKVANGDGGDFEHFVRDAAGKWRRLTRLEDGVKGVRIGRDNALYMVSLDKAPRGKILRLPLSEPELAKAVTIVPEQAGVATDMAPCDHGIYVSYLAGGPSELLYFPRKSTKGKQIPVLPVSTVGGLQSWHGDQLVFANLSYLSPTAWYTCTPEMKVAKRTALYSTSQVDFSDVQVVREFAVSKDGTKIPLNILEKKGIQRNGKNPTILYGYGGYGVSMTPHFDPTLKVWLDAGGIYVVANIRGGAEFGETWHKQGNLLKKQNVFDDFIAAAKHLVERKYTSPAKLAVEGGSNGGLLMGAFLTQRPDLARAVVSYVGIYDMLRVELDPNGQFNVTEFGTVKNLDQFKALYAYSPYHRVKDGVKYPAVLLTTGENDGRVAPYQSRKMAARLQAATSSGHPVLFLSNSAGHGIGTALKDRISEEADAYCFLFNELGVNPSPGQIKSASR